MLLSSKLAVLTGEVSRKKFASSIERNELLEKRQLAEATELPFIMYNHTAANADAGIGTTYNVMLPEYIDIYRNFKTGDVQRAGEIQRRINSVTAIMKRYGTIPATKYMCRLMEVDVGNALQPLCRLSADEGRELEAELKLAGRTPNGRVLAV